MKITGGGNLIMQQQRACRENVQSNSKGMSTTAFSDTTSFFECQEWFTFLSFLVTLILVTTYHNVVHLFCNNIGKDNKKSSRA
uniref:Uncharacterized protein n=1 Tax=Rhizophora mucronata TaxID=61149 RepID=A0A2P2QY26_RHIMU